MKNSIVIPTYNESGNVEELFRRIENSGLRDFEIIVVDDHSPDGTFERAVEAAAGRDNIRIFYNPGKRGLSPSIVYGFNQARGEYLACMDGDLQHDPAALPGLTAELDHCDFVIGSRYVANGGFAGGKWSPLRVLVSRTATYMARFILGIRVQDPMSGFFAVRREAFEEARAHLSAGGFKIMLEMLYILTNRRAGFTVREHGIIFGKRTAGESKLSCRVIFEYLAMLIHLRRSKAR